MDQKCHFQALTALKGLFILIIVLHNTLSVTPLFSIVPGVDFLILFGGFLGNSMFYILSGFLLSAGYKERIQNHGISFKEYLIRRLKKLYPMYILSNAATLLLELLRYGISAINIEKLVFTILIVRSPYNHPTGFLCALFVCYIAFFAICYFAKTPTQYVCSIAAGILAGYMLIDLNMELPYLTSGNGMAFMSFFIGCILGEVYPLVSRKCHRWLQPLLLVMVPLLMYLMLEYGVEIIAGDVKVCFAFAICPMVLYLAWSKGICSRILQFRGFVALGKISSTVFFWHLVIYFAFCDLYAGVTQGEIIQEQQYLLYFALMLVSCAGLSKLENRISGRNCGKISIN